MNLSDFFLSPNDTANQLLQSQIFFLVAFIFLIVVTAIGALFILRSILQARSKTGKAFHKTVLLVKVPREKINEDQQKGQEDTLEKVREQIAVADTLFSAAAGLKPEHGLMAWLRGRNDHFAFEIVTKDGKISFYVVVPDKLKTFLEQQIHAQYPHAEITEEPDYNIFQPQCHIVGASLWFKYKSAFPFKTYKKLDSDPLAAILNPLSKIAQDQGALIQYIVRPASPRWRRGGGRLIRDIKEGPKFEY